MNTLLQPFADPEAVAKYAQGPRRIVPGFEAIHRMAAVLLAERAAGDARILVLGAGGGLELKAFAEAHPGWRFDGVDPSAEMLGLAAQTLGGLAHRAALHQGYIDDAPEGPFDGGACLLTLHFIAPDERLRTLREVRRRLKPGAPFVAAHCSFPQDPEARERWREWEEAYIVASGAPPEDARKRREAVDKALHALSPEEDEDILRRAGFADVTLFYAAFTWRGWVAYA
ncbi:MAG: class I SAM-dependent methyltransferase [Caulobacteraceae bacterium]|nr:class I SAM-dependent methyltransferase [Caulobacteraceae bacterium]